MRARRTTCGIAIALAALVGTRDARAQVLLERSREDVPQVTHVQPTGLALGKTVEVVLTGLRLEGLSGILGPEGVRLVRVISIEEKQARVELEVGEGAAAGIHPLHFLCKAGLSNPRMIRLESLPQLVEQEDNNTLEKASAISVPCAVSGVLTMTDVDCYQFEVVGGQTVSFEVEARRLGSALRPVLTLYDARGRELTRAAGRPLSIAPDTRLTYTFPSPGKYTLKVHDLAYQGADFGVYQLRVGAKVGVVSMFPLGGRRGSKVAVHIETDDRATAMDREVDLTGSVDWRRARFSIPTPDGEVTSPAWFAVGEDPESIEQEPNDEPAQANRVETPVSINGRLEAPGDRDCYVFHATAGGRLQIRVLASDLGTPVDAIVTLRDSSGAEVIAADDREPVPRDAPVVRPVFSIPPVSDPVIDFVPTAEDDYVLLIDDLYARGGPGYAYRIEMSAPRPDFELIAQPGLAAPSNGQQPAQPQGQRVLDQFAGEGTGAMTLDRGGSGTILVRAFRQGYDGPITITAENLPPGVRANPTLIAAGQNETTITFIADFEAQNLASYVRILGTAQVDQSTLVRNAMQPVVLSALPMNGVAQQELAYIAVGVSQQGAELAVRGELAAPLAQGTATQLKVTVQRREGIVGDVAIRILNPPAGLSVMPGMIAAAAHELTLDIGTDLTSNPGRHTALIEATLQVEGRPEPVFSIFPLEFDVQALVALELGAQQVDLVQGNQARIPIRVKRHPSATSNVELQLAPLPKGVTANMLSIPPDVEEFMLTLDAADNASASPIRRIVQIKATLAVQGVTLELPSLRFALKVSKRPNP